METILVHAQALVYTLLDLMPTTYQRDSLQALLGLFLEAQGHPLPEHSQLKSPSALSRFLNQYDWSTRQVIRAERLQILDQLLRYCPRGRRPWLQVIVDLTTLDKCGKFKAFDHFLALPQTQWQVGKALCPIDSSAPRQHDYLVGTAQMEH